MSFKDSQAQRKALFRMKLKEREKRIEDPLVRYNEDNQPVCKVCNVALKSESNWPAHKVSSKHAEAIKKLRAAAAVEKNRDEEVKVELTSEVVPKSRASSSLPADFFDKHEVKKPKTGPDVGSKVGSITPQTSVEPEDSHQTNSVRRTEGTLAVGQISDLSNKINKTDAEEAREGNESMPWTQLNQPSRNTSMAESKQGKGSLPEGFFDNKDADLRARGIEPVKVDIKDEYKEFEKAIQGDLQEVDERLEEEEFDAAEMQEEAESFEQKAYRERVEMLKKKQIELRAARVEREKKKDLVFRGQESSEDSSDDGDDDGDFAVDWRAKHL